MMPGRATERSVREEEVFELAFSRVPDAGAEVM